MGTPVGKRRIDEERFRVMCVGSKGEFGARWGLDGRYDFGVEVECCGG